jgi:mono/diheme cytochrome c family protein
MLWPSRLPSDGLGAPVIRTPPPGFSGRAVLGEWLFGRNLRIVGGLILLWSVLPGPPALAEDSGKDLFGSLCASCHAVDGRARTSPGHYYRIPDWTTTDATKKLKDDQVRKQIRTGKLQESQSGMPAFRSLSDAQVDLLIAYVRKLSAATGN